MKIRDIDTLMINSPGRKWTIVRVFTDEGLVGLGEGDAVVPTFKKINLALAVVTRVGRAPRLGAEAAGLLGEQQ
mgnify:CR=1 FL=1